MKNKIWILVLFSILLILSGCQVGQNLIEETIQPETITLQTTPELTHWLPDAADCVKTIPGLAIITDIQPQSELNPEEADLVLRLGTRQDSDPFVAVMGSEAMTIVAGADVPVDSLSLQSLRAIFKGNIRNWNEVSEVVQSELIIDQPIPTLSYPGGHLLQELFQKSYLDMDPIVIDPVVFSTAERMAELLKENPFALGYMLQSQVPEGVKILSITSEERITGEFPVLAVTQHEPQGKFRELLLCLQNASN